MKEKVCATCKHLKCVPRIVAYFCKFKGYVSVQAEACEEYAKKRERKSEK